MKPILSVLIAISAAIAITLASTLARAASLTGPVGGVDAGAAGYTTANLPSYVSMYEYVPDKPAAHPPVLVVSHWYGATAAGMFGVAQGGGLVAAADQYGFIMVFPQRDIGGCWDISSTSSLTHDGGGETQAIAEMVKYEVAHRGANANRVYATGQSCGAMFTEALLGVYPDVFKGGSEFSGVPAGGCWTCSGGYVDHTPQQWGSIVEAMYSGYSGHRPRVQLWHGNADMTVNYQNQIEAIEEWTDVLGLRLTPTSTTTLTFNGHMWTREMWEDACGVTLLDAFTEQGGPHNTDASEDATYVIPFLALDDTGPADPQVSQACTGDVGSSDAAAPVSHAGDASVGPEDGGVEPEEGGASGSSTSGAGTGSSSSTGSSSDGPGSIRCGPVGGRGERSRIFREQRVLLSRATTQRSESDWRSRRGRLPRGHPPLPASTATLPTCGACPHHRRVRRRLLVLELRPPRRSGHDRPGWLGVEQRNELGCGQQLGVERRLRREHGLHVERELRFEQHLGLAQRSRRRGWRPGGGEHRRIRAPADRALRSVPGGGNPLRRGVQHSEGHVRDVQRQPLSSPARGQQHDAEHQAALPGRRGQRAGAGLLLFRDDLHDRDHLRSVRQSKRPYEGARGERNLRPQS